MSMIPPLRRQQRRTPEPMGKKQVDAAAADGAGKKKGRSNLLPAIVVAAGLLGGGYFMSGGGGAKATPAAAEGATTTTTAEKHGEVIKLDSITLNLADGRFVKLGLALELEEGVKAEGYDGKAARALDIAISTLGDKTFAELAAPGGRDKAKAELNDKVVKAYGGEVTEIYFTELVMQ